MRFGQSAEEYRTWAQTARFRFAFVPHRCEGDSYLNLDGCERSFWLEYGIKRGYHWRVCRPCYEGREKRPEVCSQGRVHVS